LVRESWTLLIIFVFFRSRRIIMVYEVGVDDHPKPASFSLLAKLPLNEAYPHLPEQLKINGDRVLVQVDPWLVVWELASRSYYILRMTAKGRGYVRGVLLITTP
jgi:hypothetical protein